MNALAGLLIALGLSILDKRLDQWIDMSNATKEQKLALREAENELMEILRKALKASSPRIVKLLVRAVPNDPTTSIWS